MLLKEEKNERLSIKFDPRVQVNVAASCSKYYFIGIILPVLWSAISNHALLDKCRLATFNILCPGTANRTIVGLGCAQRKAPLLTALSQWLLQAAQDEVPICFQRGPNSPAAATPSPTQRANLFVPNTRTETTQPGGGELVCMSFPSWGFTIRLAAPHGAIWLPPPPQDGFISPLQPTAFLEGEKFGQLLPAARQPLYCRINATNCWSRATETSKWKMKLFWAKWENPVVFFATAVSVVQTVACSDALCR